MTLIIATALGIQATQDLNPWRVRAKLDVYQTDPSWASKSKAIDTRISFLKKDSKSSRMAKLENISRTAQPEFDPPENAILYKRIFETFSAELKGTQLASTIPILCERSRGISDPSFLNELYTFFNYSRQSPLDCGDAGRKLMKFFPRDLKLQQAFLRDSAYGYAPLEARYDARRLMPSWKGKLSNYDFHSIHAGIDFTITTISKKPTYVESCREHLTQAIKFAPTEEKRKARRMMLDHINQLYPL